MLMIAIPDVEIPAVRCSQYGFNFYGSSMVQAFRWGGSGDRVGVQELKVVKS